MLELFLIVVAVLAVGILHEASKADGLPLRWKNRRLRALEAKQYEEAMRPSHVICGVLSPDGMIRCRLELGHSGWHCHHGPISWYSGQWAEDDYHRFGNIPW